jgi:hypothetical protein
LCRTKNVFSDRLRARRIAQCFTFLDGDAADDGDVIDNDDVVVGDISYLDQNAAVMEYQKGS